MCQGPRWAREHTLLSSAARGTSGSSNVINAGEYGSCILFLDVTANTGNAGTLNGKVMFSPDNVNWFESGTSMTQVTTTGKQIMVLSAVGRYVRFDYTITGSTPSMTFSIVGAFKS